MDDEFRRMGGMDEVGRSEESAVRVADLAGSFKWRISSPKRDKTKESDQNTGECSSK